LPCARARLLPAITVASANETFSPNPHAPNNQTQPASLVSFAQLLERVAKESGVPRIKFTSSYPRDFGADVVKVEQPGGPERDLDPMVPPVPLLLPLPPAPGLPPVPGLGFVPPAPAQAPRKSSSHGKTVPNTMVIIRDPPARPSLAARS
jgi:hypothetical protein